MVFWPGRYDSADSYNQAGITRFEAAGTNRPCQDLRQPDYYALGSMTQHRLSLYEKSWLLMKNWAMMRYEYAYGFIGEIFLASPKTAQQLHDIAFMKKIKKTLLTVAAILRRKSPGVGQQGWRFKFINEPAPVISEIEERRGIIKKPLPPQSIYIYKIHFQRWEQAEDTSMEATPPTQTPEMRCTMKNDSIKKRLLSASPCRIHLLFALAYNRRKRSNFENKVMEGEMKHPCTDEPPFVSNASSYYTT